MEIEGTETLDATREDVWRALFDRDVLKSSIPGCESLDQVGETAFSAVVKLKIGPVSARFNGDVELTDIEPPMACTLTGKGNGGIAGFAKGSARVTLEDRGATTVLAYRAEVAIGGKLAALGGRLIKSTAQKLADEFFAGLGAALSEGGVRAEQPGADDEVHAATAP